MRACSILSSRSNSASRYLVCLIVLHWFLKISSEWDTFPHFAQHEKTNPAQARCFTNFKSRTADTCSQQGEPLCSSRLILSIPGEWHRTDVVVPQVSCLPESLKSPCSFETQTSHSKIELFTFSAEMGRPSRPATKYDKLFRLIVFLLSPDLVYSKRYISCLRSMLTLRVLSWNLQAPDFLWWRHLLLVFLGAVTLRTQIRFCKLTLQVVDEE